VQDPARGTAARHLCMVEEKGLQETIRLGLKPFALATARILSGGFGLLHL
jgi:hypothetical protein